MEDSDLAALVKELGLDNVSRYVGRETLTDYDGYIKFGELKPLPSNQRARDTDLYISDKLSGSDYSGGLVAKSNYRVFMKEFGDTPGVYPMTGGHNSYGVAIRLDAITPAMIDIFDSLDSYSILDESDHSELEHEAQDEAWKNTYSSEFKKGLEKRIVDEEDFDRLILNPDAMGDVDVDDVIADTIDSLSDNDLYELFHAAMEEANVYWYDTEGEGISIDIKRIVKNADISSIATEVVRRFPPEALEEPGWEAPPPVDPRQMRLPGVSERRRRNKRR